MAPTSKVLSADQAQALLSLPEKPIKTSPRHWLLGFDRNHVLKAIDTDAPEVHLSGIGGWYKLLYLAKYPGEVFLKSRNDFVPCAWITIKDLRKQVADDRELARTMGGI